jgi:rhodanese-related sulfurtransferase
MRADVDVANRLRTRRKQMILNQEEAMKNGFRTLLLAALMTGVAALALAGEVKQVGFAEVKALLEKTPAEGGYLVIDARPEIKYFEGHLPGAVNLPWQEMRERLAELPAQKQTRLVFYCGGEKCDLSGKAAALALEKGYTDVAVFAAGEPGWRAGGESPWVSTNYLKMLLNDRERVALVIDARPQVKYLEGTIPGAVNLPFAEWEKRKGLLPADKATTLVFFCGGLKCDLSHKAAAKARELGYADVRTYAEGWPVWVENSTRSFALVNPKEPCNPVAAEAPPATGEIGKAEFEKLLAERPAGFLLVDVRPTTDFAKGHLAGAINIPDEEIGKQLALLKGAKNVVFYCNTGSAALRPTMPPRMRASRRRAFSTATLTLTPMAAS